MEQLVTIQFLTAAPLLLASTPAVTLPLSVISASSMRRFCIIAVAGVSENSG